MRKSNWLHDLFLSVMSAILGAFLFAAWEPYHVNAQQNKQQAALLKLQADVANLKEIIPPHSHPMVDVAMFAANLWFAEEKRNWPLAGYYLNELRNRIRWETRVYPDPKGLDGQPTDLTRL